MSYSVVSMGWLALNWDEMQQRCGDLFHLAHNKYQWRAVLHIVMNCFYQYWKFTDYLKKY